MTRLTQIVALFGFGCMGLIDGIYLENIRVIPSPAAIVVAVSVMGIGYMVLRRYKLI